MKWKDESSYKRGEKKTPNIWTAEVGLLRVVVVYNHVCYPDQWIFTCLPFFQEEELGNISVAEAKERAIKLVKLALEKALNNLLRKNYENY